MRISKEWLIFRISSVTDISDSLSKMAHSLLGSNSDELGIGIRNKGGV